MHSGPPDGGLPRDADREDPGTGPGERDERGDFVEHQPPSVRDLEQHPPRGPECLRVRAWLRAHADGELAPAERDLVDEHMHGCRECGVALSRAEAEVHRLRSWLRETQLGEASPRGRDAGPGPDFVRSVMRRVAAEQRRGLAPRPAEPALGGPLPAGSVSDDFTPRVMDRVRREWRAPRLTRRLAGLVRRQFAVLTAAAAFAILAFSYFATRPGVAVQVHLLSSAATTVGRGERVLPAQDGQRLQTDDLVRTAVDGGRAALRVPRSDDPQLDHATLTLDAGTSVAITATPAADAEPLFALREGSVAFRVVERRLSVSVDEHCTIALAAGRYRLSAGPVVRHDSSLAQAPFVAVRVEVEAGAARIVRGQLPAVLVDAGRAAVFDGWSPVAFERLLDEAELLALASQRLDFAASRAPAQAVRASDWLGRVVNGQTGAGVAGATVRVASRHGELVTTSASDGAFWLREQAQLEGATALVQVTLPMGAPGHAYAGVANFFGPVEFLPRGRGPEHELILDPLRLPAERPVMGMVLDPTGRPLSGARVTALLVDQMMGGAQSLSPGSVPAAVTGGDGRFELRGLAAQTMAHTAIYLTVEHARFGTVAAADLLASPSLHDLSLQIAMAARRVVALSGLPARTTVELLESIANLPVEAMVLVRRVPTDDVGDVARLEIAEGARLWMRLDDRVIALAPDAARADRWHPGAEPVTGALAAWGTGSGRDSGATILRGVTRHNLPSLAGATTKRGIRVVDAVGRELAGARLFLQHANGEGCYLGTLRSGSELWDLPAGGDYRLFAVGEDGAVGVLDATAADADVLNVRVVPSGIAQLPPGLASASGVRPDGSTGIFVVALTRMDGPTAGAVVHRHASAESGWAIQGVVPGHYLVRLPSGATGRVFVPSGGVGPVEFDVNDPLRPPGTGSSGR